MGNALQELVNENLTLDEVRLAYTYEVLKKYNGNKTHAHKTLGITREHLVKMIRRYEWNDFKRPARWRKFDD